MESKKSITKYIVLESIISIALGAVFMIIIWNKDEFFGKTIEDGIVRFFGGLSLIFFFSVFSVGTIGAIKLKRTDKIMKAVFYSICFWVLSLIIIAVLADFLRIGSVLIILAGIIYGFNLGLRNKPEISN
jgi:hypothetical protein